MGPIISVDIKWCTFLINLHLIKLSRASVALWSLGTDWGSRLAVNSVSNGRSAQSFYLAGSKV